VTLAHWDDVEGFAISENVKPLGGFVQRLADAAGSVRLGVQRARLAPGQMLTPPHVHSAEEEIFFVLSGSVTLWQDGATCTVGEGDTIVFNPAGPAHTVIGGDGEAELLIFGERLRPESGLLPRTQAVWLARSALPVLAEHPWQAEAALGLPEGTPVERPANVIAPDNVEGAFGGIVKRLGAAAGAKQTGLNLFTVQPNEEGAPPHCHSADEEVFVVLDGEGTLELWGRPTPGEPPATEPSERHDVRRGQVVSRPPGTGTSHCFRAGPNGLSYLAFGAREPDDVCYYPRSNKIFWRGLGLIARLEPLDWSDGEPA
jgi:uncharacterized cupin superfamily protein